MSSYLHLDQHLELARFGAIIDFVIKRDDQSSGLKVRGLIDTGASDVLIDYKIATKLGLKSTNSKPIGLAGGKQIEAIVYGGIVSVPELQFELIMPLYAAPFAPGDHNVLLGRDFLRHFIMTFNGPSGVFHFWPPSAADQLDPLDDFAT